MGQDGEEEIFFVQDGIMTDPPSLVQPYTPDELRDIIAHDMDRILLPGIGRLLATVDMIERREQIILRQEAEIERLRRALVDAAVALDHACGCDARFTEDAREAHAALGGAVA